MGDPEEAPGSWLSTGSSLSVVATWGVNQQIDLSLSPSLSIAPFTIKINLKKKKNEESQGM